MANLRIHSVTGNPKGFRRNGMVFTGTPVTIDTAKATWTDRDGTVRVGWTDAMIAEAKASAAGPGAALHVEDLDAPAGTPAEAVAAANAAGVSLPGHPSAEEAERTPPTRGRGR